MVNNDQSKFVFPLDLDGNSALGPANFTHPFVKINFYQWVSQEIESQSPNLQKNTIAQFFFATPEQTLTENFNHTWDQNLDVFKAAPAAGASTLGSIWKWLGGDTTIGRTVENLYTGSQGKKMNDFVAQAYGNIGFRRFDFLFNLIPKSKEEADEIYRIINKLKLVTTPLIGTNIQMEYPSICDAEVYAGNGKRLYKTLLSGVESLSINYSADGFMRVFKDGNPIQVQISLAMCELRRFSKENV